MKQMMQKFITVLSHYLQGVQKFILIVKILSPSTIIIKKLVFVEKVKLLY